MKYLKLIVSMMLFVSVMSFAKTNNVDAATNITIYVNGTKQSYSNKAMIKNGATLVPLRGIFEALGANVTWNQSTKTIDATKGSTKIWLKIGSTTTKVNNKNVTISVPAQVVNGSTLVPLRFIGESLGAKVEWIQASKTIKITTNGSSGTVTGDVNSGTYVKPGAATVFKNCTEMRKVYPNGVQKSHPAYESKHDRDNDGWACEQS
ncbi:MAG: stalk domain-containing protein [Solibacillus sp.]|uniref:stalk domain-containing protein n=1 Tax=unclassified Solibacillus TaxID=2637870 RepID=UPI0030F72992